MGDSSQEAFFERLVEVSRQTGDARLATATLRPRKKIASYEHAQCQRVECCPGDNRTSGNENSCVLADAANPVAEPEVAEAKFAVERNAGRGQVRGDRYPSTVRKCHP